MKIEGQEEIQVEKNVFTDSKPGGVQLKNKYSQTIDRLIRGGNNE